MNMKNKITAVLILCAASVYAGDRLIPQTVDTATARVQPRAIGFFRGESVTYTVTPMYGSAAISVSSNATAYWTACYASNINVGVINVTGTVTTAGVATFSLAVTNTLMPAGTYDSFVRIQDGASLVTASRSSLTVFKSPYAGTTAFPALSFLEPLWAAASSRVVYTNQMGSGSTWNGTQWTFAGSGGGITAAEVTNIVTGLSYPLASNPSNYCTLAAAAALTNGLASTSYVAQVVGGYLPTNTTLGISAPEGSNIASTVTASMMLTGNVATATIAGAVTGSQSNTIATAVQPAALSGYMPTGSAHSTLSGILGAGELHVSGTETGLIYSALQAEADTPSSVFERSLIRTNPTPLSLPGDGGSFISEIFPSHLWGPAWIWSVSGGPGITFNYTNMLSIGGGPNDRALIIYYDNGNAAQVFDTENPPTPAQVGADPSGTAAGATNAIDAAFLAGKGGLTNRVFVTPTALDCSPTTTITRAMIDAAPWGEMSLSLTQATVLAFAADVTSGVDVATFRVWIKGTNSLDWSSITNKATGSAWTNATANGSWRIFDKNPDGGLRVW